VNTGRPDYSYIVSKDGIYTVLSGSSGEIDRNTDALTIIQEAITDANAIKGSILIENGPYSLSSNINMKSNIAIYLQLGVTLTNTGFSPSSRKGIINFSSVTNVTLEPETEPPSESSYPQVIGGDTTASECGVNLASSTYCTIGKIAISNTGWYGLCIYSSSHNTFDGTYVHDCALKGSSSSGGGHLIAIRSGSYNKLLNVHADCDKIANTDHALYLGGEGAVTYNEIRGGIYENSGFSHATYWCSDDGDCDRNLCVGTIFRNCLGNAADNHASAFKLNAATNSRVGIDWDGTINPVYFVNCKIGMTMGDGSGRTGNYGNIIYAIIRNCYKCSEWETQASKSVQLNEVHLDIDLDTVNYPNTPVSGSPSCTYAFDFGGFHDISGSSWIQNNTIYLKVRNCQYGVVFSGWDTSESANQEARYNTFYLDVDNIANWAIYWMSGSNGYGRWNTFYGNWKSAKTGNCGSIPNANYVQTDVGTAVVATNTFNPS
jgi:hypothetical protein